MFDGGPVADGGVDALVVEPVGVLEGGELDVESGVPRSVLVDELGLVQADGRLDEGVVVGVADRANRGGDAFEVEPVGVAQALVWVDSIGGRNTGVWGGV